MVGAQHAAPLLCIVINSYPERSMSSSAAATTHPIDKKSDRQNENSHCNYCFPYFHFNLPCYSSKTAIFPQSFHKKSPPEG